MPSASKEYKPIAADERAEQNVEFIAREVTKVLMRFEYISHIEKIAALQSCTNALMVTQAISDYFAAQEDSDEA